jgi:K+-transporting ATPase ATPase C chain
MKTFLTCLRMFIWMCIVSGIVYPLVITGIAELWMPWKAHGSIVYHQGKAVGSQLIAQDFSSDRYFWPRPSSVNYSTLPSGASNLGPTSAALQKAINERREKLMAAHAVKDPSLVPQELLFASGSGLDPHISRYAANFQIDRVLAARGLQSACRKAIIRLIDHLSYRSCLDAGSASYVNVLELNICLDEQYGGAGRSSKP